MAAAVTKQFVIVGGAIIRWASSGATDARDSDNRAENDVSTSGRRRALLQSAGVTGNAAEATPQHRQHNPGALYQTVVGWCWLFLGVNLRYFVDLLLGRVWFTAWAYLEGLWMLACVLPLVTEEGWVTVDVFSTGWQQERHPASKAHAVLLLPFEHFGIIRFWVTLQTLVWKMRSLTLWLWTLIFQSRIHAISRILQSHSPYQVWTLFMYLFLLALCHK